MRKLTFTGKTFFRTKLGNSFCEFRFVGASKNKIYLSGVQITADNHEVNPMKELMFSLISPEVEAAAIPELVAAATAALAAAVAA